MVVLVVLEVVFISTEPVDESKKCPAKLLYYSTSSCNYSFHTFRTYC